MVCANFGDGTQRSVATIESGFLTLNCVTNIVRPVSAPCKRLESRALEL